jgi:hypothetical protein
MTWSPKPPQLHTTCTPQDTRGPARLWNHPAGWVMRERGDTDGTVLHDYLCPVHGRFEARVARNAVPDVTPCEHRLTVMDSIVEYERIDQAGSICGLPSPWSPGSVAVWKSSGEVAG